MKYLPQEYSSHFLKRMIFFTCFLSLFLSANGQTFVADSLLLAIPLQKEDTIKVHMLNELSWELANIDPKRAEQYAEDALNLSDSLSFAKGCATSLNRQAIAAMYQGEFDKAERLTLESLEIDRRENNLYGEGRAQMLLNSISYYKKDFKKSIVYGNKALITFKSLGNKRNLAKINTNIGNAYRQLTDYENAMKYFLEGLAIRRELNDSKEVAFSLVNIGSFYIELKDYPRAVKLLSEGKNLLGELHNSKELLKVYNNLGVANLKLGNNSVALENFKEKLRLDIELGIADKDFNLYNNIGSVYYNENDLQNALINYLKSLSIQEKLGSKEIIVETNVNIGNVYFKRKAYVEAIGYYKKALIKAESSSNKIMLLQVLNNLSLCNSQLQKYDEALVYNKQYIRLKDSIEDTYKKAVAIKANFEEDQKEKELLVKDNMIAQVKLKNKEIANERKTLLIFGLISVVVLITILFFAILRGNKEKRRTLMAQKDSLVHQQKVEELLKKQELKSIHAMIEGQEGERQRIARDLHDRLGSILSMVKVHFKSVENNVEELKVSNKNQYDKANQLLDTAVTEVRQISHDLASGVLSKFGLTAALEDLKETLEGSNQIEVEFVAYGLDDRLDNEIEITIYRIVQELVSNVLKYAQAKNITIQLMNSKNGLNVIVEDDGVGFDINADKEFGMGFKNIASRVDALDGKLNIDSTINKGTTISIDIPLN